MERELHAAVHLEEAAAALVAAGALREQPAHEARQPERPARLVWGVLVNVVHDRPMDVPAHEIDRRERGHRATRVRTDQAIDEDRTVLLRELRDLVQDLEAHPISGEARRVRDTDHHATEPLSSKRFDKFSDLR